MASTTREKQKIAINIYILRWARLARVESSADSKTGHRR